MPTPCGSNLERESWGLGREKKTLTRQELELFARAFLDKSKWRKLTLWPEIVCALVYLRTARTKWGAGVCRDSKGPGTTQKCWQRGHRGWMLGEGLWNIYSKPRPHRWTKASYICTECCFEVLHFPAWGEWMGPESQEWTIIGFNIGKALNIWAQIFMAVRFICLETQKTKPQNESEGCFQNGVLNLSP